MWLSLGKCLEKKTDIVVSLKSYFVSNFDLVDDPSKNNPGERPIWEKRLVNALKQLVSDLYTMSVIPIFDSFNTFLQVEEPLIHHILYCSTLHLYCSLLSRFILLEVNLESGDILRLILRTLMSWKTLIVYLLEQWPSRKQGSVTSLEPLSTLDIFLFFFFSFIITYTSKNYTKIKKEKIYIYIYIYIYI